MSSFDYSGIFVYSCYVFEKVVRLFCLRITCKIYRHLPKQAKPPRRFLRDVFACVPFPVDNITIDVNRKKIVN